VDTSPGRNEIDLLNLKDRALATAAEGITIADARVPGRPLIYINEGFERLTGYAASDALGRNCKFLQGADTDPVASEQIRQALRENRDCTVEILNYRKDGSSFWNRLSISPVCDSSGQVTHFIGIQSDVTARREAETALRQANKQIELANSIMRHDLNEAAEIQRTWLPHAVPEVPEFDFSWTFQPCQELGGDSLNILRLGPDHIGIYILDVTGHGVPAALFSASLNRLLSPIPEQSCLFTPVKDGGFAIASPAEVAATMNRQISFDPETGKFFTMLYGVLNLSSHQFTYVTAGHFPPLRIGPGGMTECPSAPGVPVGVLPEFPYEEHTLQLEPGDRLVLFTDGAVEATDQADEQLGQRGLLEELGRYRDLPGQECLEKVMGRIDAWNSGGDMPEDDVTLLAIDFTG
jgi:phosphoserine phosphatase RsbU/P